MHVGAGVTSRRGAGCSKVPPATHATPSLTQHGAPALRHLQRIRCNDAARFWSAPEQHAPPCPRIPQHGRNLPVSRLAAHAGGALQHTEEAKIEARPPARSQNHQASPCARQSSWHALAPQEPAKAYHEDKVLHALGVLQGVAG